ncbi:TetR/AcrR family transcriptional regulator [Streptomyces sp. H10-C2]|uniref:TetR/AcrR family transcriptional regulator n=1 Tax=unclassified Streptomyces TaxID=2593676 RepID=UPI0024B99040|nr:MULTISPECIES: TetR/AcrR family transcriptional regulator [unclassified Streptomyces]MDJ0344450.1 TetR/AcrR family transcriptional regulator [Streptomyces sp. PH10-H1]MDJ0372074.1 TetR/AcrR family transcriptional regulator [Streptomyces sp. H10-C2]
MAEKTSTPYHHGNLREALLALAEDKIEQVGVSRLSLRELARDLGVSHGAPARHFPDKQALLDALTVHGLQEMGERLSAAMARPYDDFEAGLAAFARGYVSFTAEHPILIGLILSRRDLKEAPGLREANQEAFSTTMDLIARAQTSGEIVSGDPDRVAMAVLAMVQGLATMVAQDLMLDRDVDTVVGGAITSLVQGLRPR